MKLNELDIEEASPIELLKRKLSPALHAGQYDAAAETMYKMLQRKRSETGGNLRHGFGYYAQQIGKGFNKVDYRALMKVFAKKYGDEFPELVQELRIVKPDPKDTLGIKRSEMPQVATADYPEFIDYLKDNGAHFTKETVPADSLKAIQGEFSDAGVEKALLKRDIKKPSIVSSDNYIIDGHHRWLAALNTGTDVDIFKVDIPGKKLLQLVKDFPKTTYKDIYTEAGVGKITKQNTTVDVKPGETERQAKKFFGGNGKPKPLGVKGATPNQAFNLGLTEGYKLQLERDDDLMVLHILDTASGKRTEVRGKSGYESGNYDADDKLHQLLDKLGKSVDISQLMNGEPVGIRPDHPDGAKAKAATDTAYNENMSVTGTERGREAKRKKLVPGSEAWFKHWFSLPLMKREDFEYAKAEMLEYVEENFKDGKNPGRKGLAKRSGVDCSKPVGELRKIAKNSSGEKQRMAHWCANMKSGRSK